ncbi:hypothetical protein LI90_4361 (plasmid) [Carbonactinospora thermoautotrophica]|uniref:Minor tail protein n=1 Tax=Carbonactinospora thermoautotrophica TaxID=1469144 RepID=A0A132MHZ1_9ACTN|nr:hypothetical protein [Carbonactinospora thermoautotrophica]KWW97389.1 hypothetical protein LI90_4361 [Carbonactinospora thermoautotrophica]
MAVTTTPRLGLQRWDAGSDPWPARAGWDQQQATLDNLVAIDLQGTAAARPAAGIRGRYYFAADTGRLYRDDGTQWIEVGPVGGAGPGGALAFGAAGVEGVSVRAARADHTHPMPAHDAAAHSGIPLSALAAPTVDVPFGNKRITNLAAPAAAGDAATKAYVDGQVSGLITGAGTPATLDFGGSGAEGVSSKAARADHQHPMPSLGSAVVRQRYYDTNSYDVSATSEATRWSFTISIPSNWGSYSLDAWVSYRIYLPGASNPSGNTIFSSNIRLDNASGPNLTHAPLVRVLGDRSTVNDVADMLAMCGWITGRTTTGTNTICVTTWVDRNAGAFQVASFNAIVFAWRTS